jgi:asparaginyl-tRNA synthetase
MINFIKKYIKECILYKCIFMDIKTLFNNAENLLNKEVGVVGWVKNCRKQGTGNSFAFIELNDGSTFKNLQIVIDTQKTDDPEKMQDFIRDATNGSSISIIGILVESPAKGQLFELTGRSGTILGDCPTELYPISKNRLPLEYIRDYPHLRIRTNTMRAVMSIRNRLSYLTHKFFVEDGFSLIHTPILTANDCEGAGETFNISNKLGDKPFFDKNAHLTVSGQLHVEPMACALGKVYTFGPTFRAENSNTSRHLAEFWMIEPEICFIDLSGLLDNIESYIKYTITHILEDCGDELGALNGFISKGIIGRLEKLRDEPFKRVKYRECLEYLNKEIDEKRIVVSDKPKKNKLTIAKRPVFGDDLGSELEKYLVEHYAEGTPLFVTNFPRSLKSFYMKVDDDEDTMQAVDLLVPGIGELVGGSMREERLNVLLDVMKEKGVPEEGLEWYIDLRRFGSVPHGGYGIGFERLVQLCTGMANIRDVISYPRYPHHCIC